MADNTLYADGLTFPAPTLLAGDNYVAATAPVPTLSSGTNETVLAAPVPTITATMLGGAAELSAPLPTISSTAIDSPAISATLTAPPPSLSATGLNSPFITFAETAPAPLIEIGTKDFVEFAPAPTLEATLLPGRVITVTATAQIPLLTAWIDNPAIITAANSATTPQLSAALLAGQIAEAVLAATSPTLASDFLTGEVSTADLTAATPIMDAAGYAAYTITFAEVAPIPQISAVLAGPASANYRTWCLNTRKGVLTEYNNFPFNSYAIFNGKVIAAGTSGVVELGTQDTDGSTAIAATITTGQESFASSMHKRVPRIYTSYSAAGDMHFSTITTEGGTRTYLLEWNRSTGIHQRRVPVGRGPKSRFWSFSIANVDGCDFALNDILVDPVLLKRRVM